MLDSAARFVLQAGAVARGDVAAFVTQAAPARRKSIEITEPVVARSMHFRFSQPFTRLEVIAKAAPRSPATATTRSSRLTTTARSCSCRCATSTRTSR
ncbi:hypothetical protein WS89_09990 [Burkholderia sp. MSMB1072]|uniref:hypothetical protein n=1 Tax=Burkholderia sp. MSMB1072 TaxID=1637871 RepID=UPI00075AF61D|nr:hypothetical protein [Burkholderia sp. MSMB1072]KVH62750.1 hypothetical protein WS89_09990 [Burkholderia sp. MSMB1072]